jgi:hypothetical protein
MLKHEISYTNFDDEKVTETFYFNISKSELVELDVEHQEGMYEWLQTMQKTNDKKTLFHEFKKIVLMAYGQKSPDGKRFIKNDELREEFSQSAAFEELFVQLMTDETVIATFIKGVLPKDLSEEVEKSQKAEQMAEAEKTLAQKTDPTTTT